MSKTVKKISLAICIIFFTIMLIYNTGYVYAEAPQDQNFDSLEALREEGPYQIGDIIFDTDGIIDVRSWEALTYEYTYGRIIDGFSGMAISNDPDLYTNPTYISFESAAKSPFKLEAFYALITDVGSSATQVDIKGYNGTVELVCVKGIDFTKPGSTVYGDVKYTNNVCNTDDKEYGGLLEFGESWYDIDKVVITGTNTEQALYICLDSLDFSNVTDISIADVSEITEGQNAIFRVNLTKPYKDDITVNYLINCDSATADDFDTTVLNGTLTIPANATYGEIVIPTKDDTDHEMAETFKVSISNPSVGGITDGETTCTIKDNDNPPKVTLNVDKSSIVENGGSAKITATLSNKTYENVVVNLNFSGAVAGTDFNAPTSISIPANSLSGFVNITVIDDDIFSGENKKVTIGISSVENGSKGEFTPPELTINDDEPEPKVNLSITPGSISENGIEAATVTATLTNKSIKDVTVKLSFEGAVNDTDFTVLSDTITIPSLQTTGTMEIYGKPNNKFNYDKTLTVSISDVDVTNATTGDIKSVPLTITNIDSKPTVKVDPVTYEVEEKDSAKVAITVLLSKASGEDVIVKYKTSDGAARGSKDYISASGSITIPKGEASGTIEIDILNDTLDEEDENFFVTIQNDIVGAERGSPYTAQCIIRDDDDAPDIVISDAEVDEVDSGNTTKLIFNVSLSTESGKTIDVNYSTSDDTATKELDYLETTGTLTFIPGDKGPKQIEVTVIGDNLLESNETIRLNLTATNARKTNYTATGTIKDNDKPTVSINDVSVTEDTSPNIVFKVSLSKPTSQNVSLKFRTIDGSAVAGSDYIQQTGAITFAAGETGEKVIAIDINDDDIYEGTESFYVELYYITDPAIEVVKNTGTGTIYDNESIPKISVETTPINEGNSDTSVATFTVKVSPASAKDIYVDYETLDGTAKAGKDYTAVEGRLKIPAGQKSGIINVNVKGDTVYEENETFSLILSNPEGAEINSSKGTAQCTINDDDSAPSITFVQNKVKVVEGDSGNTPMVFYVTLSEECEKTVSVDYVTEDGTATTANNDYDLASGKLDFIPGETSKSITVNINGDKDAEYDENFFVVLKPVTGDIKAEGIIVDDDRAFIKMFRKKDGFEIANGNTVNFENTKTGKESELEFIISNVGNADLTEDGINKLISISGSDFTLKNEPVSPIVGKGSAAFTIVFKPSSTGVKTAEVTITGKDTVNSPFKFKVSGTGTSDSSTGGGSTSETSREAIVINVGDHSIENVSVDVKHENNIKITTVNLDETEVHKTLNEMAKNEPDKEKKVTIPVTNNSDKVVGELKASTLKAMADMNAVLEIKTENVSYTLPANNVNIDEVLGKLGGNPELKDILVKVTVTKASEDKTERIKDEADKKGFELNGKPVEFEISFTYAGREVTVSSFSKYVTRAVAIPEGTDHKKITTGVVYNPDGSFTHVPTAVSLIDNKYYAKINSLTNSTYALIYNPLTFMDVEEHWSKDYVNDAGSRLIVSGTGDGKFTPDRAVTRAEFAIMIVKALGLKDSELADNNFSDVDKDNPYYSYISTAYKYGIITGYTNRKFGPNDFITREQSMTMISKAMKIAGMDTTLTNTDYLSKNFSDSDNISNWAKEGAAICVNSGLFVGNKGKLNPKNNVTRAESATVIIKLLKSAGLI